MSILKSNPEVTTKYEFTPEQLKQLIASDLGAVPEKVTINYKIGELPGAHQMDRDPPRGVIKIEVTIEQ